MARSAGGFFFEVFLGLFTRHMLVMALLVLTSLVLSAGLGERMGLPRLFLHPRRRTQAVAGAAVSALLATLVLANFLRDRHALEGSSVGATAYFEGCAASLALVFALGWCLAGLAVRRRANRPSAIAFLLGAGVTVGVLLAGLRLADAGAVDFSRWDGALGGIPVFAGLPVGDRHLHLAAALVFLGELLLFLGSALDRRQRFTTPGVALCLLVGLVVLAQGYVAARVETASLVAAVGLGLLVVGGLPPRKLLAFDLEGSGLVAPPRRRPRLVLRPASASLSRGPLVVVSVSGDGSAGAVWAASILSVVERRLPEFASRCRLIVGSSGASLGAAAFLGSLSPPKGAAPGAVGLRTAEADALLARLGTDALSALAHRVVTWDLPLAFLPVATGAHRGAAFAELWADRLADLLPPRLSDWGEEERMGRRPSLVIAAATLEDGAPVLMTNLDLATGGLDERELYWALQQLPVTTAVSLSCGGDFVFPACALPTSPRRRVGKPREDPGGLAVIAEALHGCLESVGGREWLRREVSGVLLVEIRVDEPRPEPSAVDRGVEELVGPLAPNVSARGAVGLETLWEVLRASLERELGPGALHRVTFEGGGHAVPAWLLTSGEMERLGGAARAAETSIEMAAVERWWRERLAPHQARARG